MAPKTPECEAKRRGGWGLDFLGGGVREVEISSNFCVKALAAPALAVTGGRRVGGALGMCSRLNRASGTCF